MRLRTGSTCASSVHFRNEVLHCKCCSGVCAKRRNPKKLGAWHKRLYNFKFVATMIASELLLQGYRLGVFPMAMEDNAIEWFSPNPRAIIRARLRALRRDVEQGQTRRGTLRRRHRRLVFWRVDVPSRKRRIQDRVGRIGRTFAREKICAARYAMAHAAFATVRRD